MLDGQGLVSIILYMPLTHHQNPKLGLVVATTKENLVLLGFQCCVPSLFYSRKASYKNYSIPALKTQYFQGKLSNQH